MREKSYKTALSGVLSALALAVMFLGGIIPFATYVSPVLASLCVLVVFAEQGLRQSLIMYAAVSVLSVLLSPDKEAALIFTVFFGYYPVIRSRIEVLRSKTVKLLLKLLIFNAAVIGLYCVIILLFPIPSVVSDFEGMSAAIIAVLVIGGNLTFLLYDKMISRVQILYYSRIRPGLIKEKRK